MNKIFGVDISNNNGNVNITELNKAGVKACIMKATENVSFKDKYLNTFYAECKKLNMKTGAYHFLRNGNPEQQAKNFYEQIKDKNFDVLVLDVELDYSNLNEIIRRFILAFSMYSSAELVLYTYTGFLPKISQDSLKLFKRAWMANYNGKKDIESVVNMPLLNAGIKVTGHQYSDRGVVGAFTGDVNIFTDEMFIESIPEGTWKLNNTGWWFEYKDKSYPTGWAKLPKGNNDKTPAWFLFNKDGYMLTSWQRDNCKWYYLNENTGIMQTGWYFDTKENKWYYLDENGVMQTGWIKLDNKWYYLNPDGSMATGWIKYKGNDYLLYSSGVMAQNTTAYGYTFDNNGVAKKIN